MDFFIKKIFDDECDELVHLQFQKFGKGVFKDRALINARKVKNTYKINTTYEYANELVLALAEKLNGEETRITGIIVSTKDLSGEIDFSDKKQFMGVKQYIIDKEMRGEEIVSLIRKMPKAFFALSLKIEGAELKIKAKSPKSAKPRSKGESKLKVDFCKINTEDADFAKKLLFGVELNDFKSAEISHTFIIDEIILPKEENDPALMREKAKRKGKVIREMNINGNAVKEEKDFVA